MVKNILTTDRIIDPSIAVPKVSIVNPGTIALNNNRSNALIKKENSPSVTMVIGKVKSTRSGLTSVVNNPQTTDITRSGCHP